MVVSHVQVRQDQARTNHQLDSLQSVRHVRRKRLYTTRGRGEGLLSPARRVEHLHGPPELIGTPLLLSDPRGFTEVLESDKHAAWPKTLCLFCVSFVYAPGHTGKESHKHPSERNVLVKLRYISRSPMWTATWTICERLSTHADTIASECRRYRSSNGRNQRTVRCMRPGVDVLLCHARNDQWVKGFSRRRIVNSLIPLCRFRASLLRTSLLRTELYPETAPGRWSMARGAPCIGILIIGGRAVETRTGQMRSTVEVHSSFYEASMPPPKV